MTPKIGPRELVHQNPYHKICRVVAQFDGFQKEYFVNTYGPRVGLLILDGEKILLVRQYRFLANQLTWELPGGKVDDTEKPEQAAVRETFEETGLKCSALKPLLFTHPGLDNFENPTFLFYTTAFEKIGSAKTDPREVVELAWIPLKRAMQMIFRKEIVDSMTAVGLMAYHTLKEHPEFAQV